MKRIFIALLFFTSFFQGKTQTNNVVKTVVDATTHQPIEGVIVQMLPSQKTVVSNTVGNFYFNKNDVKYLQFSFIGYETKQLSIEEVLKNNFIYLTPQRVQLQDVTVVGKTGEEYKTISKTDIKLRGINNSQEILRMVPGLFIGQHQGGGKAEQIFVRGFDCDHGTDIFITADGMPVNLVSHAHGQGYADMHFIIPETIENVDFQKGMYNVTKGNFTTSGFVDIQTRNALTNNTVKLEAGMFDTYRALGMFNLLNEKAKAKQQSLYVASEFAYSNGFFDAPQYFNRFNFFAKYNGKISKQSYATLSASTFYSKWNASGQIPERAVENGMIGFYGAIDDTEGGKTARTNINARLTTTLPNGSVFKNQIYFTSYNFDLISNFTYFLEDPINGDQIRQKEHRTLVGYNGSYNKTTYLNNIQFTHEMGIGVRYDFVKNLSLAHTVDKDIIVNRLSYGNVHETNAFAYFNESIKLSEKIGLNAGLRFDQFINNYKDHLLNDTLQKAAAATVSPKLSLYYYPNKNNQFYVNVGKGFHSNDTRLCVIENGRKVLPPAYAADVGMVLKPTKQLLVHAAFWYLWLQQEFVYVGDAAIVELSGKTERKGIDFSVRYEPVASLYLDVDINYAHGRMLEEAKGNDYIPLAPIWSSTGGVTYKTKKGWNGSLRYRWLSNRPANEDYSLTAEGYFVNDVVLNYTTKKYEIGLTINNLFNVKWKETQFATESRLKNEPAPVEENHFTPGTKFAAKISCSIFF